MASVKNCRGSRRRSPKHKRVEQAAYIGMDPGGNVRRLPTTHAMRMRKRDNKMWRRETERAGGLRDIKSKCPCRLCLFGRPLLRTTQARHLRDYGRHPSRRLQEQVLYIHRYVCAHKSLGAIRIACRLHMVAGLGSRQTSGGMGLSKPNVHNLGPGCTTNRTHVGSHPWIPLANSILSTMSGRGLTINLEWHTMCVEMNAQH